MKNGEFEPGDIVAEMGSGELWQLECELKKSWGVSKSDGDWALDKGTFRPATEEETKAFKPSFLYQNRRKDSRATDAVKAAKIPDNTVEGNLR